MSQDQTELCPDCRCVIEGPGLIEPRDWGNSSRYCDACCWSRVMTGEMVPMGTDENGLHWFAVRCTRCRGSGEYLVSSTQQGRECWRCYGSGWEIGNKEGVRRTARWWGTYQANRTKNHPST